MSQPDPDPIQPTRCPTRAFWGDRERSGWNTVTIKPLSPVLKRLKSRGPASSGEAEGAER